MMAVEVVPKEVQRLDEERVASEDLHKRSIERHILTLKLVNLSDHQRQVQPSDENVISD